MCQKRLRLSCELDECKPLISGTRVPGEGEVKILRSMKTREANPLFKGHSHLIVSEVGTTQYRSRHGIPACERRLVQNIKRHHMTWRASLPHLTY